MTAAGPRKLVPPLVTFTAIALVLELVTRAGLIPPYLVPAPSAVVAAVLRDGGDLAAATWSTAWCALVGLALAWAAGTAAAVAFSLSSLLRSAFYPYAVLFQTVPVIAVAPLLVIWCGFGAPTVIASAALVAVFPVIASTMLGLASTDPRLVDLFGLYGASRRQRLLGLRIPFALPHMLAGLRIAAGLAVIGAIVGEFIGGGGLGSLIDAARTQQRVDTVFAAVLLAALLGFAFVTAINLFARRLLGSWHASEQ